MQSLLVVAFATFAFVSVSAHADVPISCDGTPFGAQVTLGLDAEMVVAQPTNSLSSFYRVYNDTLAAQATGGITDGLVEPGSTFLESARADLDGNGADEIVGLYRGANGDVVVGVFQAGGSGSIVVANDAWRQGGPFADAHLVAGDFDGSQDGREEIAVAWRTAAPLALQARLLSGTATGLIAQADGVALGSWTRTAGVEARAFALAAGDLLLDGRDQLVVANLANRAPNGFVIDYHLLEYQTPWPAVLPVAAGNTSIGSLVAADVVGASFQASGGSPGVGSIPRFVVNAGDVVDGAADELVLHLQGVQGTLNFIGQRLFNFRTARNSANDITSVTFVRQDSRLAQTQVDAGTPTWDAMIGNVDFQPPSEIVLVHADVLSGNNDQLIADVWKAVLLTPGQPPPRDYRFANAPAYTTFVTVPSALALARAAGAIGDMKSDGLQDVLAVVQDGTTIRRLRFTFAQASPPTGFAGFQVAEALAPGNTLTNLDLVAVDFDNDSVLANITSASCREVDEPSVRNVVWMPPHFDAINPDNHGASFGRTTVTGGSGTTSFGAFTASDVSAYLGASVGGTVLGIGAEVSARVTAGYSYQSSFGEYYGTRNDETLSEAFVQSTNGAEALVVAEIGKFRCYEYTVSRNGTVATDSGARFCDYDETASAGFVGTDATTWDNPVLVSGRTPAQWFELQRDFANVALFRTATTNLTTVPGLPVANITDGQFGSFIASLTPPATPPYVQVDLGSVQSVTGARIIPGGQPQATLRGYRLYVSATPFAGPGVPSGPGVTVFAPETSDGTVFSTWNVRIRGPGNAAIPARYVRLQRTDQGAPPSVAELQVFAGVHLEPDRYPQTVCDPVADDNKHRVSAWNPVAQQFALIDERGDLIWSGSSPAGACTNHAGVRVVSIWSSTSIGDTANVEWSLSSLASTVNGNTRSIESTVRVGAEFDVSGGFIASVQAGGAYEFSRGVTEEVQSEVYWGTGTEMGGSAAGFNGGPALATLCRYRAQPHGIRLYERSNSGYQHGFYVVDYSVDQNGSAWTRGNVPFECSGPRQDAVFLSGFE